MPSAVDSAFDVAFWFADMALNENEYLQPQKMHRLMFLSQAYYAVANDGASLMPAVFVADEMGPIEPTVYTAFAKGRPNVDVNMFMPEKVEIFLEEIWSKFGRQSVEQLMSATKNTVAYRQALKRGRRAQISLDSMRNSFAQNKKQGGLEIGKPQIMRNQSGAAVTVKAWVPKKKKSATS
ncbi:MAG: hypothetical protein V3R66_00925 [Rhodospirillales bacterium]